MLISQKGKQSSFSFSIENFMLGCLDDKYSQNLLAVEGVKNFSKNFANLWVGVPCRCTTYVGVLICSM